MSGFFSVGTFSPLSRGSSRKGKRKVASAEWTEFPLEEKLDTPAAMKKKIVQLNAKLWEAEKKISHLYAEKSKQGTKFRAVKRAAQMETALHKVKAEADHKVEEAVTRRLSVEVEDQTAVERRRAEQAEEEVRQLKDAVHNQEREIEYLQSAKTKWQKRAKELEQLTNKLSSSAAAVKPGEAGFTPFGGVNSSHFANLVRTTSKTVSPETASNKEGDTQPTSTVGSRQYSNAEAIPAAQSAAATEPANSTPVVPMCKPSSPRLGSPAPAGDSEPRNIPQPSSPFFKANSGTGRMELLLEDVHDNEGEEAEGGAGAGTAAGEVDEAVGGVESARHWTEWEEGDEEGLAMVGNDGQFRRRRDAELEPLSFQEAYDLTAQHSFAQKRMAGMFSVLTATRAAPAESDWRKNRDAIDAKISQWSDRAALCGCAGAACAMLQNELTLSDYAPDAAGLEVAKLLNSMLTALAALCVYRVCKLRVLFHRVSMHMTRGWPLDLTIHLYHVLHDTSFLWEMLVVLPHLPPFVTFELGGENMGNFVLYRGEMMGCLYNSLRTYLLWRVIKHRMLDAFPKRHTVATYTQTELQSSFAVKVMFDGWNSSFYVAAMWAFLMLVLGYWFRSAEITACELQSATHPRCDTRAAKWWTSDGVNYFEKTNDLYIANSAWAMFVTATSVGYGDIFPLTHLGRLVASVSALSGIILIALLTAALAHGLTFTPEQHMALSLLEREKARTALLRRAAQLIAFWWRLRTGRIAATTKTAQRLYQLRTEFRRVKHAGQEDLDNFMVDTVKVNHLATLMIRARERIEDVEDLIAGRTLVELPDENPAPKDPRAPNAHELAAPHHPRARSSHGRTPRTPGRLDRNESERRRRFGPGKLGRQPRMGKRRFDPNGWKRDRDTVELERMRLSRRAALVGTLGILFPLIQNELIYQKTDPHAPSVEIVKALSTVSTMALLYLIFELYHMEVLFARISRHLDYGQPLDTEKEYREVLRQRWMWAELVACGLHLPPLVTFEWGSMQLDNYVMYRAESILCFVATLRLYLWCRVLRDVELADLPRKHTVKRFTNVEIGYIFALKRVFNSLLAVWYIAWLWAGTILVLGYWFRIGEFSACRLDTWRDARCNTSEALEWTLFGKEIEANNMLYVQNAIWTMWVTGTTVGYGDIFPITHAGRFFAAMSAGFGLVIAALFTASLSNSLIRSPQEEAALNLLRRNKAKQEVLVKAVNMVQLWWRKAKAKPMPLRHRRTNPYKAIHDFKKTKIAANAELNSMKNISGQLTDLHREGKILHQCVEEMHDRTHTALLAIVQAAKHAAEAQSFLQHGAPFASSRPGTSFSSLRPGGAEAAGSEEGVKPVQRRTSVVEFFADGRRASVKTFY